MPRKYILNDSLLINHEWTRKNPEDNGYRTATPNLIDEVEDSVQRDPKYKKYGKELDLYLGAEKHHANINRDIVIHKILLIDYTNSTNLKMYGKKGTSVFSLADKIVAHGAELDQMIQDGHPEAVEMIAGFETVNLFSFATKYCCYHNTICYGRDDYSIYDNIVAKTIPFYLNVRSTYISGCRNTRNYLEYKRIIDTLIAVHELQDIPNIRRKIDHFLWYQDKQKDNE